MFKKRLAAVAALLALATNAYAQTSTVPISNLPTATSVSGSEYVPCVQGGVTKKCTSSQLGYGSAPHVGTEAALAALPSTYAPTVVRDGYYAAGDSPSLTYVASASACANADGGAQITASDGNCWIAGFPSGGYDVREWGAKCDGSTNDTTPIQAAINYASTTSKTSGRVLIPAAAPPPTQSPPLSPPNSLGGCVASVTVTAGNNIVISGAGYTGISNGGSKLIAPNLTSSVITIGNVGNFSLENILVAGAATSPTQLTSSVPPLIYVNGSNALGPNDFAFRNVYVENGFDLVKLQNMVNFRWFGGALQNFTHTAITITGNTSVLPGGGNDDYLYGLIINEQNAQYQNQGTLSACLYTDQNAGSITVESSDFIHCHVGIWANPGANQYVQWLYISDTYLDTCDYAGTTVAGATNVTTAGASKNQSATYVSGAAGLKITPNNGGVFYGGQAVNLWTSTCTNGVQLAGDGATGTALSGFSLTNLHSLNTGGAAVYTKYATDVGIANPLIAGAGQLSPQTTYAGVELDTGTDKFTMGLGRIGATVEGYSNTMKFGIQFDAGFTGSANISNVNLSGNFANGLFNASSSTGITVSNSPGFNPQAPNSPTVSTGAYTYHTGFTPEYLSITGGTVSSVTVAGTSICSSSPCSFTAPSNTTVVITNTVAPTLLSIRQ